MENSKTAFESSSLFRSDGGIRDPKTSAQNGSRLLMSFISLFLAITRLHFP
jgi:hypothetical protein